MTTTLDLETLVATSNMPYHPRLWDEEREKKSQGSIVFLYMSRIKGSMMVNGRTVADI